MLETGEFIIERFGMKLTGFPGNTTWSGFTMALLLVCTIASMLMALASSGTTKESTSLMEEYENHFCVASKH